MKTHSKIAIAGVLLASMSLASQGNPYREDQFKAKYGRYTPAEETRLNVAREMAASDNECQGQCCKMKHATSSRKAEATRSTWMNSWFQAKWGRPLNSDARTVSQGIAAGARNIVTSLPSQAMLDAWSRAKFGRVIRRADSSSETQPVKATLANSTNPTQPCCERPNCCD